MTGIPTQMDLFPKDEELEGHIFELYEKTDQREFKNHVRFIKADSLCEAEDFVSETDPNYWRTRSVRSVSVIYVWKTFEELHFSYQVCKSILGLEKKAGDR